MPARLGKLNLVARPDRVDFRDRAYQPPLKSLTDQYPQPEKIAGYFKKYVDDGRVLDQGAEGACTGYGLAAVVNYIYWARWMASGGEGKPPVKVSPHMFYRNARVYDEWEGEDYEGSSCRGAMKGWYKLGVCEESNWPKTDARPDKKWSQDAALRPLGAYYRVDAKSIADMQAAIFEVNAVYCSATVHAGWNAPRDIIRVSGYDLAVIVPGAKPDGGHAFAIVGYTRDGFIVQNSWNKDWGTSGFALLTYEDWIRNGNDAWVAALGAPTGVGAPSAVRRGNLMAAATVATARPAKAAPAEPVAQWSEAEAYSHSVVMGNDGKLLQRLVEAVDPADALRMVVQERIPEKGFDQIAVYVHGGLNSEEAAINRVCRLGPWFTANGIHPIFVVWRTGIMEAIGQIGLDEVKSFEEQIRSIRAKGFGDIIEGIVETAREAFDRTFEVAAEKFIGKAVWSQMKQNAAMAAEDTKGIAQLVSALKQLDKPVHLLGHSAGSIIIGHMLDAAKAKGLSFKSCSLYAPACTLDFAARHFGMALKAGGPLGEGKLFIDILSDQAEVNDGVGPYGKSLLYLVSRALEDTHKMPLLGLDIALKSSGKGKQMELNKAEHARAFAAWQQIPQDKITITRHTGPKIKTGPRETVPIAHGTFDNDLKVINDNLERILETEPKVEVTDLTGY